jgi:hypothetical protein
MQQYATYFHFLHDATRRISDEPEILNGSLCTGREQSPTEATVSFSNLPRRPDPLADGNAWESRLYWRERGG